MSDREIETLFRRIEQLEERVEALEPREDDPILYPIGGGKGIRRSELHGKPGHIGWYDGLGTWHEGLKPLEPETP